MIDHRSYTHNLSSCEIKPEKNSDLNRTRPGLNLFQALIHNFLSCVYNCDDQS